MVLNMVIKFALLVMIVFLNSAIDGKYLLVKVDAEFSNKGFEAEQDNRGCLPEGCKYILSSTYICGDIIVTTNQIFSQLFT